MPDAEAIIKHYDSDPDENPWVHGEPPKEDIEVVRYVMNYNRRKQPVIREIYDRVFRAAGLL